MLLETISRLKSLTFRVLSGLQVISCTHCLCLMDWILVQNIHYPTPLSKPLTSSFMHTFVVCLLVTSGALSAWHRLQSRLPITTAALLLQLSLMCFEKAAGYQFASYSDLLVHFHKNTTKVLVMLFHFYQFSTYP